MSKKTIVAILFTGILILLASCGGGDSSSAVTPVSSKTVDVSTMTGTSTEWFPANASTKVSLTNIPDDELLVVKVSPVSDKGISSTAKASDSRLLPSEAGDSIVTSDDNKDCNFSGSEAGFGSSTQMMQIKKIPVIKHTTDSDSGSYELFVVDANGKSNGKVYISNSQCGEYYVDEKAMYFDLSEMTSLSKCVLSRNFQYYDGNLAEDPHYEGLHNTRDTYGLILEDANGNPYIKNSGVMDLSSLSSVMVYAGFASNVIMGSGMTVSLTPVSAIKGLGDENKITVSNNNAAIGIELSSYPEGTKYALVISNFRPYNHVDNFSLRNTSTEIRDYAGNKLRGGFPLSYLESENSLTYYIGELTGNAYIDIHKQNDGNYDAKLITVDDETYNTFTKAKKNTVYLVVTSETDTTVYGESELALKKTYNSLSSDNKSGEIIYNLSGFTANRKIHYTVTFQHWNGSSWVDTDYNSAKISCTVYYASTGNRLMENDVDTSDGSFPIRMQYRKIEGPVRAKIVFSDN